jgi:hypothetical protein
MGGDKMKNLLLTMNEIEFLKNVTSEHLEKVGKAHSIQEPLIEFLSEETYVEFLEKLIEKLKI